ncbi:peptidoglycan recognition family protein [Kribbella sp. NPDC026611]|uniref:peptidoglycan recognition protein family protein n=1 Tax=Kribbella sp. NPDC026611 TaxID=3154911 RepID=UPI003403CF1B
MVTYLPRSAWNARPPNGGPGNLTVSRVEGAVIHWPGTGTTKVIHTQAAVASALRGWQDYHMDTRGWSDIAYQVAVDQAGRAWTLRGLRTQSGANGDNDVNERYGAILLVLVTGEQPSAAMKATTRAVIADFRKLYPRGTAIRPHSAVRPEPTDCPGDPARAAIARGDFTPGHSEDDMTPAQMQELKNFIEARTQAYALWTYRQLRKDLSAVVRTYALDIKNYERQTDAADAARAAAAVWATAPKSLQVDTPPTGEPTAPDPNVDPDPDLPDLDPFPTPPATNGGHPTP